MRSRTQPSSTNRAASDQRAHRKGPTWQMVALASFLAVGACTHDQAADSTAPNASESEDFRRATSNAEPTHPTAKIRIDKQSSHVVRLQHLASRLELGPSSATRGSTTLAIAHNGGATPSLIEEELLTTPGGVRQQWHVRKRPAGDSPLEFRIPVGGATFGGTEKDGHVFRNGSTNWHYGAPTWIDATGVRTAIHSTFEGGAIHIRVPTSLVTTSAYPAVLDPDISVETAVGSPPITSYIGAHTGARAVRLNNDDILLTWVHEDDGVIARRFAASGAPIDPVPNLLAGQDIENREHSIACSATRCLLSYWGNSTLVVKWLGADGLDIGNVPKSIDQSTNNQFRPIVLADNDQFYLAYARGLFGEPVYDASHLVTFDAAGAVESNVDLPSAASFSGFDAAVFRGDVVVGYGGDDGLELRNASQGTLIDQNANITSDVALAASPNELLMVFRSGFLMARWFDAALQPSPLNIPDFANGAVRLGFDDGNFHLTSYNNDQVGWYQRLMVIPPGASSVSAIISDDLDILYRPSGGSVVGGHWFFHGNRTNAPTTGSTSVYRRPLLSNTSAGPAELLSVWHESQRYLHMVAGPTGALALWFEQSAFGTTMQHLDANGLPVGPTHWIPLGVDATTIPARAALDDGHFELVSGHSRWRLEFDPMIPPSALPDLTVESDPIVAWTHQGQATFAYRLDIPPVGTEIVIRRHDPDEEFYPGLLGVEAMAAVSTGPRSLLVTAKQGGLFGTELLAHFVEPDDSLSSPVSITNSDSQKSGPAVAHALDTSLIVWVDNEGSARRLRGARLRDDGTLLDPQPIEIAPLLASHIPRVVAVDDNQFLVAWRANAAGGATQAYAAYVTREGKVLDAAGIPLAPPGRSVGSIGVAQLGDNKAAIAYVYDAEPKARDRAYVRTLAGGVDNGTTCSEADLCASRVCEDGVCCSETCGECEACDANGECQPVTLASDDTCFGDQSCSDTGACLDANGQTCSDDAECASGHCVDGVCCGSSCDDGCSRCDLNPGTCVVIACGDFACGEDRTCLTSCSDTSQCAAGRQCQSDGICAVIDVSPTPVDGGCGCQIVGGALPKRRPPTGFLVGVAAALAWTRRRRST